MRPRRLPLLCFAAALALVAATADAQWYESYERAERALAEEDWGEAVRQLNAALEEQPESGDNQRTYGMRFVAYFPYLKLGIAYYHLGQHDAALEAFETELRQGAVDRSAADRRLLDSYRQRIENERAAAAETRQQRASSVVADGLATARAEEERGRIEDALAAVDRVLAVAPDDTEAVELRRRLLAAVADEEVRRQQAERFAALMARGRRHLEAGRHGQAASSFREALALRPGDGAAQRSLAAAQEALRDAAAGRRDEVDRRDAVTASLARAEALAQGGELASALDELQTALALEPGNGRAQSLQRRWLAAQTSADAASDRERTVAELLAAAEEHLVGGDFEAALRTANRVLALEPGNETALRQVSLGYARLSDLLLSDDDDAPPVLLLDAEPPDDGPVRVRAPELVLTGTVYDATPV
ncbi:MAG TPA: hypothetical protein VKU40_01870, partial [Thermoanaerobaculia bacterium]|nr:hypothetical protein [Thermoanaerobaculia bacterium]